MPGPQDTLRLLSPQQNGSLYSGHTSLDVINKSKGFLVRPFSWHMCVAAGILLVVVGMATGPSVATHLSAKVVATTPMHATTVHSVTNKAMHKPITIPHISSTDIPHIPSTTDTLARNPLGHQKETSNALEHSTESLLGMNLAGIQTTGQSLRNTMLAPWVGMLSMAIVGGGLAWMLRARNESTPAPIQPSRLAMLSVVSGDSPQLSGLLFDCDGVIADTEPDGHRVAFNAAFKEKGFSDVWSVELYGKLLETGGGKERMTAYWNEKGWPEGYEGEEERSALVKELHLLKTNIFNELINSGKIPLRPGVLRLLDEALAKGIPVAVCSTSSEQAVTNLVRVLMGEDRLKKIQIYAGDIVKNKKPSPDVYNLAATNLNLDPSRTLVVEDSSIGLAAAKAAGMKCIITKSSYAHREDFTLADHVVEDLDAMDADFGSAITLEVAENLVAASKSSDATDPQASVAKPAPAIPGLSEDVLERLRKAEEEAAALREQLAVTQASVPVSTAPKRRIDGGGMKRETIFSDKNDPNWLVESQAVDLLTGGGPGETGQGITAEGEAVVRRRLLIGGLATAGLGAFALVPTETFRPKPSKPLFFYLTAVVKVQNQLEALKGPVADGQVELIAPALARMLGPPGDIKSNVDNAIAWLDDAKEREQANRAGQDFLEYLKQVDYTKYFENMKGVALSGADRARYSEFSLNSLNTAQAKLKDFLRLMPAEDLEAARTQASTNVFG